MLAPAVMGILPSGIHNRTFADFDNAIAGSETGLSSGVYKVNMCPLVAVMVDVIHNFAEQNTLVFKNSIRFLSERRVGVRKGITPFLWRLPAQAKPLVKILLLVSALVRDVRWVVNHYVKEGIPKRSRGVIRHDGRAVVSDVVNANNSSGTTTPKSTSVQRGVEDSLGFFPRIRLQHHLQDLGVLASPH